MLDRNCVLIEAVYDNRFGSSLPTLALTFVDGARGVRVAYPLSARVDALRICRAGARPAPPDEASRSAGLAYEVADSDFLAWIMDESCGVAFGDHLVHHAFAAGNDVVDVLAWDPPAFDVASCPPSGRVASAPACSGVRAEGAWRVWNPPGLPKGHYELATMTWSDGGLSIVLESLADRIEIVHDKAIAMRACDEGLRLKPNPGWVVEAGHLIYRVEKSDLADWVLGGSDPEQARGAELYSYSAFNDIVDVLALDPPLVTASPLSPAGQGPLPRQAR